MKALATPSILSTMTTARQSRGRSLSCATPPTRLLLLSKTDKFPNGLANSSGQPRGAEALFRVQM
jgi:hypothetical protein